MTRLKQWMMSFWSILIRPNKQTFISITQESEDHFGETIAWIEFIIFLFFAPISIIYDEPDLFYGMITCMVMVPIWFLLFVFLMHRINQILSKNSHYCYDQLLFSTGTIFVVTSLIFIIILYLIDFVFSQGQYDYFLLVPVIYWFVLTMISVRAITESSFIHTLMNVIMSLVISLIGFIFIGSIFMLIIQEIPRFFY
jgi:hypothetical protein